jgi:hypothetical protein
MPPRKVEPDHLELLKHTLDICRDIAIQANLKTDEFLDLLDKTYRKSVALLTGKQS